ncbi:MAG TPA: AAA family ATPase [Bacillota bacterium]|nr:AAA family ATPase [Bacillota bacterium]
MKIKRIEMTNFRNHHATSIELDNINVFVGRNNTGKSSIKAAIEYALTGRCEWTDGAGRGAERLVRHGAASGSVGLAIENLGPLSRAVPGELQVADWKGGTKMQQSELYKHLGAGADVISAVLNTSDFINLSPDEQKNMLFNLMGLTFNKRSIVEALEDHIIRAGKANMLTAEFFSYAGRFVPENTAGGPEVLDSIYKEVFKERTGVKKTLKELEALAKAPAGSGEHTPLPPEVIKAFEDTMELARLKVQINTQLQELKDRKEELIRLCGQAAGSKGLIEKLKKQYNEFHEQYEGLYAELQGIQPAGDELEKLEASLPELLKKVEATKRHFKMQKSLADSHKTNLDAWTAARDKFTDDRKTPSCPVLPKLKCTADTEALLEQLNKEIDAVAKLYEQASQEAAVLEKDAVEAEEEYARALKRAEELHRIDERIKQLSENIQATDSGKRTTLAELERVEKLSFSTSEMEVEINQLSQRIPKGEELLRAIAAEERVKEERNRVAGALEKKRQEVAWLESLVEAFGPKGMKAAMLAEVVGMVQARANERLALLTGGRYGLEFDLEKGFEIRVTVGDVTTDVKNLSTSERMRVGIILQDVLNSLTGLRILVIDDCEILDPQNKGMLINLLLQIRDDYDTIIILSALGETQPRNPGIPGLSMFMVEDGAVQAIPAPEAA